MATAVSPPSSVLLTALSESVPPPQLLCSNCQVTETKRWHKSANKTDQLCSPCYMYWMRKGIHRPRKRHATYVPCCSICNSTFKRRVLLPNESGQDYTCTSCKQHSNAIFVQQTCARCKSTATSCWKQVETPVGVTEQVCFDCYWNPLAKQRPKRKSDREERILTGEGTTKQQPWKKRRVSVRNAKALPAAPASLDEQSHSPLSSLRITSSPIPIDQQTNSPVPNDSPVLRSPPTDAPECSSPPASSLTPDRFPPTTVTHFTPPQSEPYFPFPSIVSPPKSKLTAPSLVIPPPRKHSDALKNGHCSTPPSTRSGFSTREQTTFRRVNPFGSPARRIPRSPSALPSVEGPPLARGSSTNPIYVGDTIKVESLGMDAETQPNARLSPLPTVRSPSPTPLPTVADPPSREPRSIRRNRGFGKV